MAKKRKIFSGKITEYQTLVNELNWLQILARIHGFDFVKPASRKKEDIKAAIEENQKRFEDSQRPPAPKPEQPKPETAPEPPKPPQTETAPEPEDEEEKERRMKKAAVADALTSGSSAFIISALMDAATPAERILLRSYDSDDIIQIAAIYANDPDFSVSDAIDAYEAQRQEAFDDIESGNDDVWSDFIF